MLILRDKPGDTYNGLWLATTKDHHESLSAEFPNMRSIGALGKSITGSQMLPADSADFEQSAIRACALILGGDLRIGKVPKVKKAARCAIGSKDCRIPLRQYLIGEHNSHIPAARAVGKSKVLFCSAI